MQDKGILIAPNFIHRGQGIKSAVWSKILMLAGIKFEHHWTKDAYESFLSENGFEVKNSREMPSRITMLYTECVKAYSDK